LQEEKLLANPVALIRQKSKYIRKQQTKSAVRRLSKEQWETCLAITQQRAEADPDAYARNLFILSARSSVLF